MALRRSTPSVVAKVAQTTEAYVPQRNYLDGEPDHVWRNGKPDYTAVNQAYLAGKTRNWAADSLESLVESVVKTLEMEISHKVCVTGECRVRHGQGWGGWGGGVPGCCLAAEAPSHKPRLPPQTPRPPKDSTSASNTVWW